MNKFLIRIIINGFALYAAVALVPGIVPQNPNPVSYIWLALIFGLVNAILSDIEYEKKFSIKNPNLLAIEELEKVGVQFYVCGQSMAFLQIGKEKLTPLVHPAISAKYSFVTLGQMGYVYLNVSE